MEIKRIAFFNYFHNGDIFLSKPYVKHIAESLPQFSFSYAHSNGSKIIKDIGIDYQELNSSYFPESAEYFINGDTLLINTHVGKYFSYIEDAECNWITTHKVYEKINKNIFDAIGVKIKIKDIKDYVYETDYSCYDIPSNLSLDYENTVMISNGNVMSGQSNLQSMDNIIHYLVNVFPEKKFILTHESSIQSNNILYTKDLIQTNGSDLNEISYIADKHCKYIIGRQSGPFIFMNTSSILNNKNKKIFSLRYNRNCDFLYQIKVDSEYFSILDKDINYVFDIIEKNLRD